MNSSEEPTNTSGTVPFWFSGGLLVLICWSAIVFLSNVAGFRTDISDPSSTGNSSMDGDVNNPLRLGRNVFENNCAICHQASGRGIPSQYPPLTESEWVNRRPPKQLVAILLYGLQGPVVIKGTVYNGNMPAWNHLSDAEIAAVLSYIRSNWDNRATALTPEEVSSFRKAIPVRVEPWTVNELQELSSPTNPH